MRKTPTLDDTEQVSPMEQPLVDEPTLANTYMVIKPIIYRGEEVCGVEVTLTDRQAKQLRESGHIA